MGNIGYLELLRFDSRDVAGWRSASPLAELGFDAIEVFNGDHYAAIDQVEAVLSIRLVRPAQRRGAHHGDRQLGLASHHLS